MSCPNRPSLLRHLCLCCTVLLGSALPALEMSPVYLGSPFMQGWVPDDVPVLRGLIVLDGFPLDGRWNEAARHWRFGIFRLNGDGYTDQIDEDDPTEAALADGMVARGKAILHGIDLLAERTGHPELAHVPWVTAGYSRYSGPAQRLVEVFPGRVLCFLTGFGISSATINDKITSQRHSWLETPSQFLGCEWENIYSGGDKRTLLTPWRRAPGVLRMAGMTWRVYHNPHNYSDLGMIFVDQVIKERLPADWDPRSGPPTLRPVQEAQGWLGSHAHWYIPVETIAETETENATIAPFEAFEGDRTRASWILNEAVAWVWRAMSSRQPEATIIHPGHPTVVVHEAKDPPPVLSNEHGLHAGEPFLVQVQAESRDLVRIDLFANQRPLGGTERFSGGETALGSTRHAIADVEVTIDEPGVYGLLARYTTRDGRVGWAHPVPMIVQRP